MTLVSPSQSNPGEEINASDINGPVNQIASVVNGNLDDTNIASLSGTKITTGTIPVAAMVEAGNIETRFDEALPDFVASGCVWTATSGLTGAMTAGVIYLDGKRTSVGAVASRSFTASRDTYVSVTSAGVVGYSEVTNGAAAPSLTAGSIWLAKIVTNASAVTAVYISGGDSNGNEFRPSSPFGDWRTFTPTVSASTGSFTSASAGDCRYSKVGKTIHFKIRVNITTNGTASGRVMATLPFPVDTTGGVFTASGREDGVTGKMLQGKMTSTGDALDIFFYDNTYPGANNAALILSGTYETI